MTVAFPRGHHTTLGRSSGANVVTVAGVGVKVPDIDVGEIAKVAENGGQKLQNTTGVEEGLLQIRSDLALLIIFQSPDKVPRNNPEMVKSKDQMRDAGAKGGMA